MAILEMKCIKQFMQLAQDGVDYGWHEKNGGNLSYRMKPQEVEEVKETCTKPTSDWMPIGTSVPKLGGEFFTVTGTTRYLRNVPRDPERSFGITELDAKGENFRIWWGLTDGGRPTSEFAPHLMNHEVKVLATAGKQRVIYHAHPTNLIALTFVLPLTDKAFTRALWEIMTECPVIFPEGVGVLPWMVPGCKAIAVATSKLMKKYNIVVWAHHGLFCAGDTFDTAFGLMETIEKASAIKVAMLSTGLPMRQTITTADLQELAAAFKITLNPEMLKD